MKDKSLQIEQLNAKMTRYSVLKKVVPPPDGWIKAIRMALGMSLRQLGNKLSVTKQGVLDIERREQEGSITIKSLKEVAHALDMELVYGFVPKDGSLDALIEKRAEELAKKIVMRTANTMKLEEQSNSKKRIATAIRERTSEIIRTMPKMLWD
ncbi:MAG TPA: mobile mystery protein A [Flavobacteriales bacterium]|nr:mobile mystery protein A [Flavobacteriales bacterium]HRJ38256.1 mobile mystery protein A [Flavobacteriales bacterium]